MPESENASVIVAAARTPRRGAMELLQVASVVAFGAAWFLYRSHTGSVVIGSLVIGLGVACLAAAYVVLLREPEAHHKSLPTSVHGFRITAERLYTLKLMGVPRDILAAIRVHLLDRTVTRTQLQDALYGSLGQERVRPSLRTILLYSRVYVPPPRTAGHELAELPIRPDDGAKDPPP